MMLTEEAIKSKTKEFIFTSFFPGKKPEGITDTTSFLDAGLIDSTGVLELVNFIQEEYDVTVDDSELIPENLDSLAQVAAFVKSKLKG